jgi:hypothetical protein
VIAKENEEMDLTTADLTGSAETLRRLLAAIDSDEITASAEDRARLEGAIVVLETLTNNS